MKVLNVILIAAALALPAAAFANNQTVMSRKDASALIPTVSKEEPSLVKGRALRERRPMSLELQPGEVPGVTKALATGLADADAVKGLGPRSQPGS